MAKKFKYKVLGGTHRGLDNVTHRTGQTFSTKENDLMERFPNKFERVGKFVAEEEDDDDSEESDDEEVVSKYGDDVTELFPHAEVASLLVFKSTDDGKDWYNLTKEDDVNKRVNRKRMKEEKVIDFVKKVTG